MPMTDLVEMRVRREEEREMGEERRDEDEDREDVLDRKRRPAAE